MAEAGAEIARQAGLDATPRALRGLPKAWPAVLREAERIGAAVVVAGSRGLGGVKSALFGSVSSGLLHHSVRPLLVVPPADADADGEGEGDAPPGPVTIGYDGSEPAGHAIEAAAGLLPGREAISTTIWTPYTPVAGAGAAGAPAAMIAEAAARLDEGIESAARRTADEGARLAAEAGLEARAEARQTTGTVWRVADPGGRGAPLGGRGGRFARPFGRGGRPAGQRVHRTRAQRAPAGTRGAPTRGLRGRARNERGAARSARSGITARRCAPGPGPTPAPSRRPSPGRRAGRSALSGPEAAPRATAGWRSP